MPPPSAPAAVASEDSTPGLATPAAVVAAATPKAKSGGWRGPIVGVAIAVVGVAAAVVVATRPSTNPAPAVHQVQAAPQNNAAAPAEAPKAVDAPKLAEAAPVANESPEPADQRPASAAPAAAPQQGEPAAAEAAPKNAATPAPAAAAPAAAANAKPASGDLASAMEKAVGPNDGKDESVSVDGPKSKSNGSIPEQPPQGSVQAAVRGVMGGAKACVAGADDVTRATITFGSGGSVSGVSVSGWGASHGATGCIKSALQGAQVGPFSKPSFTVGVTIRP